MKNRVVKAFIAQICIAVMTLSLTGCADTVTIVPGSGPVSETGGDEQVVESKPSKVHDFGEFDSERTETVGTGTTEEVTHESPDDYNNTSNNNSGSTATARYMSAETQAALDSLDTDIHKVRWGVQYSPTGMDHIVISLTPYYEDDRYHLVMAITNLYYKPIILDASGYAKGLSGENIADISIYESMVGPGNSIIVDLRCSDIPSGEIHWDEIETPDSFLTDAYWESDWSISKEDNNLVLAYKIYSADVLSPGYVYALALDENGYVIDSAYDYNMDEGTTVSGTMKFTNGEYNGKFVNVAFFTNPTLEE
jgi:hypothetical protein